MCQKCVDVDSQMKRMRKDAILNGVVNVLWGIAYLSVIAFISIVFISVVS